MGWTEYNLDAGHLLTHEVMAELQAAANERAALYAPGSPLFADEAEAGLLPGETTGVGACLSAVESMVAFSGGRGFEDFCGHVIVDDGELYWLTTSNSPTARQQSIWPLALGAGATGWPARVHGDRYLPDADLFNAVRAVSDLCDGYLLPPVASASVAGGNLSQTPTPYPATALLALASSYSGLSYAEPAPAGYGYFFGLGRWALCSQPDPGPPEEWLVMWEYYDHWSFALDTSSLDGLTLAAAWLEVGDLSGSVGPIDETVTVSVWIGATQVGTIDLGAAPDYTDGYPRWLLPISTLSLINQTGTTTVLVKIDPQSQMTAAPANWPDPQINETYVHGVHALELRLVVRLQYDYRAGGA